MIEGIIGLLGTGFLAILGWAVQISNRVSIVETQRADLNELLNSKFAEVYRRLDRIERIVNHKDED